MTARAILSSGDLPVVGASHESATLEFKGGVDVRDSLELAKDVAALANQLGGTILIGAVEGNDGLLERFRALDAATAADVQTAYERAALNYLSPRPRVTATRIAIDGGECVAVNVEPYVDGIVGARANAGVDHAWRYPLRVGKEVRWMTPEEVARMTPQTRKALVMLSKIGPTEPRVTVRETLLRGPAVDVYGAALDRVDAEANVFFVRVGDDRVLRGYPLDMIRTVYREESGWVVALEPFR